MKFMWWLNVKFINEKASVAQLDAVFKPGISVLGPRGPYPPKNWGHMKKSGDSTINDQNFKENVPVRFRCGYFAP